MPLDITGGSQDQFGQSCVYWGDVKKMGKMMGLVTRWLKTNPGKATNAVGQKKRCRKGMDGCNKGQQDKMIYPWVTWF